ncbi:reverse transcriptase domain-containing protein [Tanacetum coccineum]
MAHDSMNHVVRQGTTVARNANNKRKWGSDHGRNFGQQQSKRRRVVKAHAARTSIHRTTQRAPMANQKPKVTCYECGKQGHFKSDCPKLKNQNCRGFLDSGDKKKKDGGSKVAEGSSKVLGDLASRVKNIEGKPMQPGILKKAMRTVASNMHDVVIPLNDGSQADPQGHKGDDKANIGPNVNEGGSKPTMSADVNKENSLG